jgi:lysophosphatidylcholine acyltransferase/lyso-PAF acetyltransferase
MPKGARQVLPAVPSIPRPSIDPFVNATWKLGPLAFLRLATIGIIIAPVKLALGILGVILSWLVVRLATIGADLAKPLPPWRRALLSLVTIPTRFVLWTLGVWYVEEYGRPDPNIRMIVSNHLSFIEPVYFVSRLAPSFLSKRENIKIPFIGPLMNCIQVIWVDRNDKDSRLGSARALEQRTSEDGWPPVMLFPEGTCGNGKALMQFRGGGAFAPGCPVQPVVVRYPHLFCDPSFGPGVPGLALLYRVLSQLVVPMRVDWLPVHEPTAAERANPVLYATNVRAEMAAALNVPTTEHTYDDVRLSSLAERVGLKPWLTAQFELFHLKKMLGAGADLTDEMIIATLRDYAHCDKERGWITIAQWRAGLALPDAPLVNDLFAALDVDGTGRLSVRTFVAGVLFLRGHFSAQNVKLFVDDKVRRVASPQNADGHAQVTEQAFMEELAKAGVPPSESLWRRVSGGASEIDAKQWSDALRASPSLFVLFSLISQVSK